MEDMQFSVEIYNAEGETWLYICREGDSGCKFHINSIDESADYIKQFMLDQEGTVNY